MKRGGIFTRLLAKAPSRHEIAGWGWMRPIAPLLRHDIIWRFNRRTVRRGVALGLFMGTVVPFGQSFAAALFAAHLRAHLGIAALCTFITNPFTTPFFYLGAFEAGTFVLGDASIEALSQRGIGAEWLALVTRVWGLGGRGAAWSDVGRALAGAGEWFVAIALPVLLGLLIIGAVLAAAGYAATEISWRAHIRRKRRWRRGGPGGLMAARA